MSVRALVKLVVERSNKFNWNEFKAIDDPRRAFVYAMDNDLLKIGQGTTRCVFALSSKRVIKIAHTFIADGIESNRIEHESSEVDQPYVPRVFDHSKSFSWIVSELVRPLRSWDEFKEAFNVNDVFIDDLKYDELRFKQSAFTKRYSTGPNSDVLGNLIMTIPRNTLSDADKFWQWGKTPDGRVVILDTGV